MIVHAFVSVCYISCIIGGLVADYVLGRYETIIYFNIVYMAGNILIIRGSTTRSIQSFLVGLMFVAFGIGGIKPCSSAFGGDQIAEMDDLREAFFMAFYLSINVGGAVAIITSPVIAFSLCDRRVPCYYRSFEISAAVHIASVVIFVLGTRFYKIIRPSRIPTLDIILSAAKRCKNAIVRPRKPHASSKRDSHDGVRARVESNGNQSATHAKSAEILKIFFTCSCFWMLSDQMSSTWMHQGREMNGSFELLARTVTIKPPQMTIVNAALIIALSPLFANVVYPHMKAAGYETKPLQRMWAGMFLSCVGFVSSCVVEIALISGNDVSILWQIPQYTLITVGEILLSITGLEFVYTEALPSMKSLMLSMWMLSAAAGNLGVVIIIKAVPFCFLPPAFRRLASQSLFAFIGAAAAVYLIYQSRVFKYSHMPAVKRSTAIVVPHPDVSAQN